MSPFAFEIYWMAHETYRLPIRFLVREIIIIAIICVKNPRITSFLINNMKRLTSEYPDFPILYEDIRYKFTKKNEMRIDFLIILTKNITEWLSLAICHGFLCRIHYI